MRTRNSRKASCRMLSRRAPLVQHLARHRGPYSTAKTARRRRPVPQRIFRSLASVRISSLSAPYPAAPSTSCSSARAARAVIAPVVGVHAIGDVSKTNSRPAFSAFNSSVLQWKHGGVIAAGTQAGPVPRFESPQRHLQPSAKARPVPDRGGQAGRIGQHASMRCQHAMRCRCQKRRVHAAGVGHHHASQRAQLFQRVQFQRCAFNLVPRVSAPVPRSAPMPHEADYTPTSLACVTAERIRMPSQTANCRPIPKECDILRTQS